MSEELAARIRRLREARGLTRTELAERMRALGARTEPYDLARYEAGECEPKLRIFAALA
jgi:transcriptional regulator with XRE-family HTH domain